RVPAIDRGLIARELDHRISSSTAALRVLELAGANQEARAVPGQGSCVRGGVGPVAFRVRDVDANDPVALRHVVLRSFVAIEGSRQVLSARLRQLNGLAKTGVQVVRTEDLLQDCKARLACAMPRRNTLHSPLIAQCLGNAPNLGLVAEHEMQPTEDVRNTVVDGARGGEDLLDTGMRAPRDENQPSSRQQSEGDFSKLAGTWYVGDDRNEEHSRTDLGGLFDPDKLGIGPWTAVADDFWWVALVVAHVRRKRVAPGKEHAGQR